ncbi:MAG: hypothetical protein C6W54_14835 [Bacillaceae bacterium]|uniref:Uncharacterized protein n=1 Tax=Aeribacillus pallidus TaxID=33936 RepID=A0A165WGH5_9BACI|nr:hypothetical protein AZI98_16860 [Aeribacillus pallidus]REJ22381.1 MAG: hypothetical protein C6W54_14835 [Bacillaceae bacterium]
MFFFLRRTYVAVLWNIAHWGVGSRIANFNSVFYCILKIDQLGISGFYFGTPAYKRFYVQLEKGDYI